MYEMYIIQQNCKLNKKHCSSVWNKFRTRCQEWFITLLELIEIVTNLVTDMRNQGVDLC